MFYLLKVLIERQIHTLDRPFSYACLTELNPKKGERVIVSFNKKQTIEFKDGSKDYFTPSYSNMKPKSCSQYACEKILS